MADSTVKYLNKLTWLRAETKKMIYLLQRQTSDFSIREGPPHPKKQKKSYIAEVNCPTQPNCIAHFDLSLYHVLFHNKSTMNNTKEIQHGAIANIGEPTQLQK